MLVQIYIFDVDLLLGELILHMLCTDVAWRLYPAYCNITDHVHNYPYVLGSHCLQHCIRSKHMSVHILGLGEPIRFGVGTDFNPKCGSGLGRVLFSVSCLFADASPGPDPSRCHPYSCHIFLLLQGIFWCLLTYFGPPSIPPSCSDFKSYLEIVLRLGRCTLSRLPAKDRRFCFAKTLWCNFILDSRVILY